MTVSAPDTSGIDLDELALAGDFDMTAWGDGSGSRAAVFKKYRDEQPVTFLPEFEIPGFPQGPGFWSVTRFDDVMHVSRNPELFGSSLGTNIPDLPVEILEFYGSMINMDAPRHTRMRLIVNKAFTPKRVAAIDHDVRVKARQIVAAAAPLGECDFVETIAAQLPLQIICEMMGIPRDQWHRIFELTNIILGGGDRELVADFETLMNATLEMSAIASAVGEDRLANPRDDLVSAMMHAEVDGERLSPMEMASFFILLAAAGNETTRNAISHGTWLLHEHPEQKADWMANVEEVTPTAIEEIVRYASPVIHFRRTAMEDTEVGGVPVAKGDKVVMWYESANRDERHFEDPYRFDIRRSPNEHVGFGGGGPHFCLGANLARREIATMFDELFRWLPDLEPTASPDYLRSNFIHGIKRMPCRFTPAEVPVELDDDPAPAPGGPHA
jgi:cytochrome P450